MFSTIDQFNSLSENKVLAVQVVNPLALFAKIYRRSGRHAVGVLPPQRNPAGVFRGLIEEVTSQGWPGPSKVSLFTVTPWIALRSSRCQTSSEAYGTREWCH